MKKVMIETIVEGSPEIRLLKPEHIAWYAAKGYYVNTQTGAKKWLHQRPYFSEQVKACGWSKKRFVETVCAFAEKIYKRRRKEAQTVREQTRRRIENRLSIYLEGIMPLRTSNSSWGGGIGKVKVALVPGKKSKLVVSASKEWSSNGKWCGNITTHTMYLNPTDTFQVKGGMLTVFPKKHGDGPIPCTWYVQRKGFEFSAHTGFLVEDYHCEVDTAASAMEEYQSLMKKKERRLKKDSILDADTLHHKHGFCYTGIENFCRVNGIDEKTISLDNLREIVHKNWDRNIVFRKYLTKIGV